MNYSNPSAGRGNGNLQQRPLVVWFTGLSGAGKTTLARGLQQRFRQNGYPSVILDGDELRDGINSGLGFSKEDRMENIRRAAEIAKIINNNEIFCIVSTISPYPELREKARMIIGVESFVEVFVNTPFSLCEERDVKGFYKKARQNQVADFTGVQDAYIPPENPDLEIRTDILSIESAVSKIFTYLELRKVNLHRSASVLPASL